MLRLVEETTMGTLVVPTNEAEGVWVMVLVTVFVVV